MMLGCVLLPKFYTYANGPRVLKIVKSVSRIYICVLKTEAVFIFYILCRAKGDDKKKTEEMKKMCIINFTF